MSASPEPISRPRCGRRSVLAALTTALTTALVALLAVPLLATPAAAASTATVVISQVTTPLAVSIEAGGTVTWINSIPDRTDLLGVTLATDVTLAVPSGTHKIAPGANWSEVFYASCLTCTITYKYRVTVGILPPLVALPSLPASLPMVVNTVVPLPNVPVPPVNVPSVPLPAVPAVPGVPGLPSTPGVPAATPGAVPATPGTPVALPATPGGTTNAGASVGEQIMPSGGGPLILGAPNGYEQRNGSGSNGMTGGTGTGLGSYDGAQAPVFGVLEGLDNPPTTGARGVLPAAQQTETVPTPLGTPALLAVLLLSVVSAGLIRTANLSRRRGGLGTHSER